MNTTNPLNFGNQTINSTRARRRWATLLSVTFILGACGDNLETDCANPGDCEETPAVSLPGSLESSHQAMRSSSSGGVRPTTGNRIWHVDPTKTASGSGLTWNGAFNSLETAISHADQGDRIWLKQGIYHPERRTDPNDPRSATFQLPLGVRIIGGFLGHETAAHQRVQDPGATILSGDLGITGNPTDNAYRVAMVIGTEGEDERPRKLYNLTIADGYADQDGYAKGAALRLEGAMGYLYDVIIRDNYSRDGGALLVMGSELEFVRGRMENNQTDGKGGALFAQAGFVHVANVVFAHNEAQKGGAVYLHSIAEWPSFSAPYVSFTNVLMHHNSAVVAGGAAYLHGSHILGAGRAHFSQCTIVDNDAGNLGGGIRAKTNTTMAAQVTIENSIVAHNQAPTDTDLSGEQSVVSSNVLSGALGVKNISAEPVFVDRANHNYRLDSTSPSVGTGDYSLLQYDILDLDNDGVLTEAVPYDLDGRPRLAGGNVDQGAYERVAP